MFLGYFMGNFIKPFEKKYFQGWTIMGTISKNPKTLILS